MYKFFKRLTKVAAMQFKIVASALPVVDQDIFLLQRHFRLKTLGVTCVREKYFETSAVLYSRVFFFEAKYCNCVFCMPFVTEIFDVHIEKSVIPMTILHLYVDR